MVSLTVLRQENEAPRFRRQTVDSHIAQAARVDARRLARALSEKTDAEVRFDDGSRALYATDGSNYRQAPIGVVVPRSVEDVITTVNLCHEFQAPVLNRGGGTSLAGQCCNVAVVIDFTKYLNRIIEVDPDKRIARVQPGCVLDTLRKEATQKYGLTFGPDPATHNHCAIGGMLGNNSCGVHSMLSKNHGYGLRTSDNTHELEILTYHGDVMRVGPTPPDELDRIIAAGGAKGEIYARMKSLIDEYGEDIRTGFPKLPRRVSGYNLDDLLPENDFHVARALVGSESTLVTILEASLHLVPNSPHCALVVLGYKDVFEAADHVPDILPLNPIGLEGIDDRLINDEKIKGSLTRETKLLPPGGGWLYVEFGGQTQEEADARAAECVAKIKATKNPPSAKLVDDAGERHKLWEIRESSLGSTAFVPGKPDTWGGFEDSAVPPEKIGPYLRELRALFTKFGLYPSTYGHFGQGIVHCRVAFDLFTAEGVRNFEAFMSEAADLVIGFGGSLSGEHGDGQSRAQFLGRMFGARNIEAFREFKDIWDPHWMMNPGKVIDPNPITSDLRLGPDYNPPTPKTWFKYPDDGGAFHHAVLRCVGVGKCRRHNEGTMCPSYQVTREEMHSTRGRARLLWEMMNGQVLTDGWRDEAVRESLDLCLSCKGCKGECPVGVDMATYKAEFLAHHYAGRPRPRSAYAFGFVPIWSRLASHAPGVANLFSQTPGLSDVLKVVGGVSPERRIPPFAPQTFKNWFAGRQAPPLTGRSVLLWPDTFNNYFHPDVGRATVEVLEDAGYDVIVPQAHLCCGRPLYDYGFLDTAVRWLRQILHTLRPYIHAGVPMVVMEPSCCAVFRDELKNLLPNDMDANRLNRQTFTLGEFLERKAEHYSPPTLKRKALLHGHCHHKAIMGLSSEQSILKKMGMEIDAPDSGCCGMAGGFGFTNGPQYDVSIGAGERVLLPKVREMSEEDVIVTDGFSCKEQIEQTTDRHAMHLAQVIQTALHYGPRGPIGRPEAPFINKRREEQRRSQRRTMTVLGTAAAGVVGAAALYAAKRGGRGGRSR